MSEKKAITDSSVARMAGNIAAGFVMNMSSSQVDNVCAENIADSSVLIAKAIVARLEKETP